MSILLDKNSKILVQGITGRSGKFHTQQCREYGSNIVAGVTPGRGGIPFPGKNPVSTASTPTGGFRVDGKFRWATMVSSSDSNIVHSEVQWVQNFHGPHALHGAYWHDAWGELKSGGCINLSPIDSKWVFDWTDPQLPKDWHGIRSVSAFGAPTRVIVRR